MIFCVYLVTHLLYTSNARYTQQIIVLFSININIDINFYCVNDKKILNLM